jgi:hypothetical protein
MKKVEERAESSQKFWIYIIRILVMANCTPTPCVGENVRVEDFAEEDRQQHGLTERLND